MPKSRYSFDLLVGAGEQRRGNIEAFDRRLRLHAEFNQKPRRYRAGPSEPSAAMNQHVGATAQDRAQLFTGDIPLPVCTENLIPDVIMVKPAKNRLRFDASDPLSGARDRRIFVQ